MGKVNGEFIVWVLFFFFAGVAFSSADGLGVNWGAMSSHRLEPKTIVQLLQDNGIKKVKIFDADESTLTALAGTGIEVMIAIPNEMLAAMDDYGAAKEWVKQNVTRYIYKGGVNITYVAVGNEPFLKGYNGSFANTTFPALKNVHRALSEAGLANATRATIPLNADVYDSPPSNPVPSAGRFRADIADLMAQIVAFLGSTGAPFTVNIYPFLSLYGSPDFPVDYAFFDGTAHPVIDGGIRYTNVFDANFDTLVSALDKVGFGSLPIVIGEVGWPTDGDASATVPLAERFYAGLMRKLGANQGTPLRLGSYIEVYLFGLLDEDAKSLAPGNFERHWGIFRYDGQPKFPMDLSGGGERKLPVAAKNVRYLADKWCVLKPEAKELGSAKLVDNVKFACAHGDCTSLGHGSSCGGLDEKGSASYAFNTYYQTQNQADSSCDFQGLAMVTTSNASVGDCNFTIQVVGFVPPGSSATAAAAAAAAVQVFALVLLGVLLVLML